MSQLKIDDRLWSIKARNLSPYVPGEQPTQASLCKLNTNENPFPPSPMVATAITQALQNQAVNLRLYPEPESDSLRQGLATYHRQHGITPSQVFVGNGSDEVLALVFACFFIKDRALLTPDISYGFYPVYADTLGVEMIKIPLREDFSIHSDDYRRPCAGIIIANPNAPTGILMPLSDIHKLCQEHPNAVVVIDEAYIDFAQNEHDTQAVVSAISLINEFDNLLVVQTFSKSRSLAGLRVGVAFANVSLIEALIRMKNSFNSYPLDRLAQAGALASLSDQPYFEQVCQLVQKLRQLLTDKLVTLGFDVLPSQANFVFAKPPKTLFSGDASVLAQTLREQGIIVRHFNQPRVKDYLRISVGDKEQIQRLIVTLYDLIKS